MQYHLIPSHLLSHPISTHPVSSHPIRPISSQFISSHLISSHIAHRTSSHSISSHLISSHPILSDPIPSHPIPSHLILSRLTSFHLISSILKEFHRQGNSSIVDQHRLPVPVATRYIRFHPTQQHIWNCLRVEVYSIESKLSSLLITSYTSYTRTRKRAREEITSFSWGYATREGKEWFSRALPWSSFRRNLQKLRDYALSN